MCMAKASESITMEYASKFCSVDPHVLLGIFINTKTLLNNCSLENTLESKFGD